MFIKKSLQNLSDEQFGYSAFGLKFNTNFEKIFDKGLS